MTARQLAAVALVLCLAGCGAPESKFIPVTGKVTYKGEALPTGSVVFVADASKGNTTPHEPRGIIDATGNYQVTTAGKPGAPAGWYKIAVLANKPQDTKNPYGMPVSLIPKKYGDAAQSGLSIEVVAPPASGSYDLTLK